MTEDQAKLLQTHAAECHAINRKIKRLSDWIKYANEYPLSGNHLQCLDDVGASPELGRMIAQAAIPLVREEIEVLQRRVDDMPLLPEGVE